MAIDTPAKIAILGAGPVGLEAALYARFLGFEVAIFEAGEIADSVRRWGHIRMFTPFGMNRSPLGLAAIQAQDDSYRPPADDELLTGRQWVERYLLPLSQTDLLADHIRTHAQVVAIGKEELLKGDLPGHTDRGDWPFRLLVRSAEGQQRIELADAVIDCSGVFTQTNYVGHGGIPAIGELAASDLIDKRLPDISGKDRDHYAGKHTLLVGGGYSAATNAVALARLAREAPGTRVTWITRREGRAAAGGPIEVIESDRLPERAELARAANSLTTDPSSAVTHWPATLVERIDGKVLSATDHQFTVELSGRHAGTHQFDRILANTGFQPDRWVIEELQIHRCYATDGPMKLAAALLGQQSADCLDQTTCGPNSLVNSEPYYYILGAKSYGRKSNFLLSVGLDQIREVFTIIGDREALDLYANVKLPR
ncbi:MAG: NAD(P)-binding domain-containing protein [Planctomycetaceae bacterium]|nr:NAD(P)-binding domain-containing protein [Planctomycetaceae bacterium]